MKYINNRLEYLDIIKKSTDLKLVKEGTRSGPFENDIPWGDSLVGRLINSAARKVGIAWSATTQMKPLVNKLRSEFEYILESSLVTSDDKGIVKITLLHELIKRLKTEVEKEEYDVNIINSLIYDIVNFINNNDVENGDTLKNQLKDFQNYIKSNSQVVNNTTTSEESKSVDSYPTMIKNLKSLSLILSNYKKIRFNKVPVNKTKTEKTKTDVYLLNGKKVKIVRTINSKEVYVIYEPYDKYSTRYKVLLSDLKPLNEKVSLLKYADFIIEGSLDRNVINSSENITIQSFNKLKNDIIELESNNKGISISIDFINSITSESINSNNKELIKKLYSEIKRYLIGDKKATIQEKDALYKESIDILKDDKKLVIVAEKISRFTKRALQFDKENLYGGLGDLGSPLKNYVDTMKQILNKSNQTNDIINTTTTNTDKDIKTYFVENVDIEDYALTNEEITKAKSIKEGTECELNIDHIIEVLKLFNRAYKIHTTNTIPGGRSGGAVSRSVYNEYTPFGSRSGNNGITDGPYRNNKLFDLWESAVLDIMKERKYQPLFMKDTKILVGDKFIKGTGSTFKRLLTDLLDTEKLYNKGAQQKFLNEYFGYDANDKNLGVGNDTKTNAEVSEKIIQTELTFISNSELTENTYLKNKKFENRFFMVKGTENGEPRTIYFMMESIGGEWVNVVYSTSFVFFKKYISDQEKSIDFTDRNLNISTEGKSGKYLLRYTKIRINDISKILEKKSFELNSVSFNKYIQQTKVIKPTEVLWLCDASKNPYELKDLNKLKKSKQTIGGWESITNLFNTRFEGGFSPVTKIV